MCINVKTAPLERGYVIMNMVIFVILVCTPVSIFVILVCTPVSKQILNIAGKGQIILFGF